jgi:hypothetical protein
MSKKSKEKELEDFYASTGADVYTQKKLRHAKMARETDSDVKVSERRSPSLSRKDFSELENIAVQDPILMTGCSIYQKYLAELIDPKFFKFDKRKAREEFKSLWKGTNFQEAFLQKAPFHLGLFGNALVELAKAKGKPKVIADFITSDIRHYDFLKTDSDAKEYSSYGSEVAVEGGYPVGWYDTRSRYEGKPQKFKRDDTMMHLAINQVHYTEWGWGFIELLYTDAEMKRNIKEARTQKAYRQGYPVPLVQYGDERNAPHPRMRQESKAIMESLADEQTVGVNYPSYITIDFMDNRLPTTVGEKMVEEEEYIDRIYASVFGIPIAILYMTLEGQPAHGMDDLTEFFEYNLKHMTRQLRLEDAVRLWMESRGIKTEVELKISDLLVASKKEKIMRIFRLAKHNLINRDDKGILQQLRNLVGLDSEEFGDRVESAVRQVTRDGD